MTLKELVRNLLEGKVYKLPMGDRIGFNEDQEHVFYLESGFEGNKKIVPLPFEFISKHLNELKEITPWDDIKKGELVVVWDEDVSIAGRYVRTFSRVNIDGKPTVFSTHAIYDNLEKYHPINEERWDYCVPLEEWLKTR